MLILQLKSTLVATFLKLDVSLVLQVKIIIINSYSGSKYTIGQCPSICLYMYPFWATAHSLLLTLWLVLCLARLWLGLSVLPGFGQLQLVPSQMYGFWAWAFIFSTISIDISDVLKRNSLYEVERRLTGQWPAQEKQKQTNNKNYNVQFILCSP